MRLLLAAAENDYYREVVAPLVDRHDVVYAGEVDRRRGGPARRRAGAALSSAGGEPFGLVLAEAAACGTPVAALDRGAVREIVEEGITGCVFESLDALVAGLPRVLALDRRRVRARAEERFGVDRMVDDYLAVYAAVGQPQLHDTRRADMNPSTGALHGQSLLAVFAHPDDESLACGGLLAWCAGSARGCRFSV